jgi:hypothetical protein
MDCIFLPAGVLNQLGGFSILLLCFNLRYLNSTERRRMVGSRGHRGTLHLSFAKYASVRGYDRRIPLQLNSS